MPISSNSRRSRMLTLPVAPRYLRRNASRAMGGSLIRGLIELFTNARDSAFRLLHSGRLRAEEVGSRPIQIDYFVRSSTKRIIVRDRFEGMTAEVMSQKLIEYGRSASGFDEGLQVRGLNARGAKDVGALGEVRFESIHEDVFAECVIQGGQYSPPVSRPVTGADRERLQIRAGNGTVVTLTPLQEISLPSFDALARDLHRHIEIRYQPSNLPHIPLVLRETRDRGAVGREQEIAGFDPTGDLLLEREIVLPEHVAYGPPAVLRLYRSAEPLAIVGRGNSISRLWRSEAGVLVDDGHTAHDLTFFHAQGSDDPVAEHIFGSLHVPQIANLLKEYERVEAAREQDPSVPFVEINPAQVTDPDRLGLNREHPFARQLEEAVRPLIEDAISTLERELAPPVQDRVSARLRDALDKLGEQLAQRFETTTGTPNPQDGIPLGLSAIPAGIRVEVGKAKRVGVYLRCAPEQPPASLEVQLSSTTDAIQLSSNTAQLQAVEELPWVYRGSFEVTGRRLADLAVVQLQLSDLTAILRVSVREPPSGEVTLDKDLQFSQRRYSSVPGRRKQIEIFGDPSLSERDVEVRVNGDSVALNEAIVHLEFDQRRGVAAAAFFAESASDTMDIIQARCGEFVDEATIQFQDVGAKPRVEFVFDDVENFGPGRRFKWDHHSVNKLHIAWQHYTLARVLGPATQNWPGQHQPQTRAILAELIADAYVSKRIQADLPSLGIGPDNSVDPTEYESYRYRYFEECFPICHNLLTPKFEA
jgi:hypothetical protein